VASAPKSNRAGQAYWAAAGDVAEHGSLPVPLHLRSTGNPRMKQHGIGVGYRYPHDFEGADVEQQYLSVELGGRHYYLPTDQGYEVTISERMQRRAAARSAAKESGRTPRDQNPKPEVPRGTGDRILKTREANRKQLAETEKRDAAT
jgi:replication-associated recombination protein RarA